MTSAQSLAAWCHRVDVVLAANEKAMKDIPGRRAGKQGKGNK